ncbi:hypothetical protein [Saccharothrix violaceirubra]|uniref:Uncharacterized protein n=1 Tax=Saccharothrix violaceirubra TaxID=413306 RepID=A0A7W7T7J6_9PSEU|nr:hypothetical protein [Saccharothrix violaceirubra]MBB4968032.1 hypothetical protein [Saccharothrix violaceirubra]
MADPTEKERLDVVEPKVAELLATTERLTLELHRVSERVLVLERRLSGTGWSGDEDLDEIDDQVRDTVAALRSAWDAEQELLADSVRVELRQEVAEFDSLRERQEAGQRKLAAGRITRFERDTIDHEVNNLEWQIEVRTPSAAQAAARLQSDAIAGEESWRREAVIAGEKARQEIRDAARRRVEYTLGSYRRPPVWFTIGLGEVSTPDPTPWLRAAIGLVAYRLEYGVRSPVTPLGDPPSPASGSSAWVRRYNTYTDLNAQLAALRP